MVSSVKVVRVCSKGDCFNELDSDPKAARVYFQIPGSGRLPAGHVCGLHADELEKATVIVPGLVIERAS